MKAADIMTRRVITVRPDMTVEDAARLMLKHRISGLPVTGASGDLEGLVTESDLLRRAETGTERHHGRWLAYFLSAGRLAQEYAHSHGRRVREVMTHQLACAGVDTPVADIVELMEAQHVKRIPILRNGRLVGIVSRADLLKGLARQERRDHAASDRDIREAVLTAIDHETWAPSSYVDVSVTKGTVTLHGVVFDARERDALRVLAENVPGVKGVLDDLVWIDPYTGLPLDANRAAAAITAASI